MTRICWIVLGVSVVLFSSVPHAVAGERIWLVTESSPGKPSCEEFYDKWEAPGVPSAMLAMAGLGREAIAAKAASIKAMSRQHASTGRDCSRSSTRWDRP